MKQSQIEITLSQIIAELNALKTEIQNLKSSLQELTDQDHTPRERKIKKDG